MRDSAWGFRQGEQGGVAAGGQCRHRLVGGGQRHRLSRLVPHLVHVFDDTPYRREGKKPGKTCG
jgi:hypothetical protein